MPSRSLGEGGGVGYLLKERITDISSLCLALERLGRGESVIDPEVVAVLLGRRGQDNLVGALTTREREILALMAEGRSNHAIGETLYLTINTVESHIRSIFSKLGLLPAPADHRRVLAVLNYLGQ